MAGQQYVCLAVGWQALTLLAAQTVARKSCSGSALASTMDYWFCLGNEPMDGCNQLRFLCPGDTRLAAKWLSSGTLFFLSQSVLFAAVEWCKG